VADEEIEIPVLVKTPGTPDGSVSGVWGYRNTFNKLYQRAMLNPWVLAVVAIFYGGAKAVFAWRAQEKAVNSLNQALMTQGLYSKELSKSYQDIARAVQTETAFSDEEVIAAQAALQNYLGDKEISKDMLMRIADFATANGMELSAAANLIGKSVASDSNALGRYGISIEEGLSKSQKLAAIMGELDKRFHGQAAAHAQGLGSIDQMFNALNTVLERVGQSIAPLVSMFASQLARSAIDLMNNPIVQKGFSESLSGAMVAGSFIKAAVTGVASVVADHAKVVAMSFYGTLTGRGEEFKDHIEKLLDRTLEVPKEKMSGFLRERELIYATKKNAEDDRERYRLEEMRRHYDEMTANREAAEKTKNTFLAARSQKEIITAMARYELRNDAQIKRLNEDIANEKDETARLELELKKRKIISDKIQQKEDENQSRLVHFQHLNNKANLNITRDGLDKLSDLKNSKYGPQVLIGKAASIASIGINTAIAIPLALAACAAIPPPVGEIIGPAFAAFLSAYAAEQIANIAGVDIDTPGRIGETPFNFEVELSKIAGLNYRIVQYLTREVFSGAASVSDKVGDAIEEFMGNFGPIGDLIGGIVDLYGDVMAQGFRIAAWIADQYFGLIADIVEGVTEFIAGLLVDVVSEIGNAIADIADALFGWLFAEGGSVTHPGGVPVVTPLHKSGIDMGLDVSVRIRGGVIPSHREAQRIAKFIHSNLR
jgi:hypothetical protein